MYEKEIKVAIEAVKKACQLSTFVLEQFSVAKTKLSNTQVKSDNSPVTIADYGAQVIVNSYLSKWFPDDMIMGEEDSKELAKDDDLCDHVLSAVNNTITDQQPLTKSQMLTLLDRGNGNGGPNGRFWTCDPIDGTKGFLRGDQFAVCLALVQEGQVKVGVLGCPNYTFQQHKGVLFYASHSQGSFFSPLSSSVGLNEQIIKVSDTCESQDACFCESWESSHSNHYFSNSIARDLKIIKEPIRMDSQCKYAAIATGRADIYLRLPTKPGYVENIWKDHAAGDLIVREAGGKVTDLMGNRLDFSQGRKMVNNKGVVATNGFLHDQILSTVNKQKL